MTGRSETTFKYVVWENSLQTWMNGNGTFYIWNLMFKDCSPKFHYDPAKVTMGPYFESSTIVCGKTNELSILVGNVRFQEGGDLLVP